MSEAYREAGVNLELGDELSKMLYEASKQTWQNRAGRFGEPTADFDSFSGLRSLSLEHLLNVPKPEGIRLNMGDDGVGTKVEVAQRVGDHRTIAFDLLAMICDDAAVKGFEPAAVTTTLDVNRLDESMRPAMRDLSLGYVAAAHAAKVALVNGEVAELGDLVGGYGGPDSFKYNWNATFIAAGHTDRLLDGSRVQAGDALVAFKENGFRSNGLSLVRKTLQRQYGDDWHHASPRALTHTTWGGEVLKPSVIYTPILTEAIGGYDLDQEPQVEIHGAAHITGGGIPGKLGRLLQPSGLGAYIEDPFEPPYMMSEVQDLARIKDEEAYKVWNMGNGMIVATPAPYELARLAARHNVAARTIGVVADLDTITIHSAGQQANKILSYPL